MLSLELLMNRAYVCKCSLFIRKKKYACILYWHNILFSFLALFQLLSSVPAAIQLHIHYLDYKEKLHTVYNIKKFKLLTIFATCMTLGCIAGKFYLLVHSSEIRGLRWMKCSSETLQNLLYFMYKKTHVVFFIFHFIKNIKLHEMKNEKNYMGFLIHKI